MTVKESLYKQCSDFVESRLQTVQRTINEIQEALTTETKSTAGDKHETGRAMLQLEREKAGNQLAEIQKLKEILSKIDITKQSNHIGLGSVVYTTKANYFLAVSAGEIVYNNQHFFAISPNTPIGKLLLGNTVGATVKFRTQEFEITEIL
ncbi:3-oxoacyl-ACP synthase [Winogradskyella sp. 3972H.M.0a.05]|uniref:3-oxoacyl-ACP synthase n=1 Tax=Winogradskyella sp. 3972H.M.0a.05 TaxID=2950277 RepID=UPI0033915F37